MKYLIPIDRSSIKRNEHYPHLGRYEIYPRELTRIDTYRGYGLEANGDTKWVLVSQEILEPKPEYEYVECIGGAPKYFFSYNYTTLVTCDYCNESFKYEDLEYDCDSLDTGWTETKCPKCGVWNCCEIEFEEDPGSVILEGLCSQPAK